MRCSQSCQTFLTQRNQVKTFSTQFLDQINHGNELNWFLFSCCCHHVFVTFFNARLIALRCRRLCCSGGAPYWWWLVVCSVVCSVVGGFFSVLVATTKYWKNQVLLTAFVEALLQHWTLQTLKWVSTLVDCLFAWSTCRPFRLCVLYFFARKTLHRLATRKNY
jgi:hypothetical protein